VFQINPIVFNLQEFMDHGLVSPLVE
jgi:hypothetical protein